MATSTQYNPKSPAVKRLMKEACELRQPTEEYFAQPLEENLFEWHFTLRGPKDTCFSEGIYHGRIVLPTEYPIKPPHLFFITPNGRFQVNRKICLSISGHHPEIWQPAWSIRTILLALIAFMPSESLGTIGSLDYSSEERKELAKKSIEWSCNVCGKIKNLIKEREESTNDVKKDEKLTDLEKKDKELLKMINFKGDIDQQSTSVNKVITKISTQDNEINENNTTDLVQNERINESTTSSSIQNDLNRIDQPLTRTNHNLLARISPVLICILILIIILKRLYLSFF